MNQPPDNDHRPPLEPPRFRLSTLMLAVAVACMFLALLTSLTAYGTLAAILLTLSILGHMLGATLGHQLRANGSRTADNQPPYIRPVASSEFAPVSRLSRRNAPGRLILIMTITWALLGMAGGATFLAIFNGEQASVTNVAAGASAFGVLGAIWGFALASFVKELLIAWLEAQRVK